MRRLHAWFPAVLFLLMVSGCARRVAYTPPMYVPGVADWSPAPAPEALDRLAEAWLALQAGDVATARRICEELERQYPGWGSPRVVRGWTWLATDQLERAARDFQSALQQQPQHVGALVGLVTVYELRGDWVAALEYADFLRRLRPDDATLNSLVARVELQATRTMLDQARRYRRMGDMERADYWYKMAIARMPQNVDLLLEYADWLVARQHLDEAVAYFQLAYNHNPDRLDITERLADALYRTGRYAQAVNLYRQLLTVQPEQPQWLRRYRACEAELKKTQVYSEYQQIQNAAVITRGQLAAMLCLEFPELMTDRRPLRAVILQDIRGHWAASYIARVVALGLMPLYAEHRFEPEQPVNRGEFADVLYRVLRFFGRDAMVGPGRSVRIQDISPLHRQYRQIQRVLSLGLMRLDPRGRFRADRPVTGKEAYDAIQALRSLVASAPGN